MSVRRLSGMGVTPHKHNALAADVREETLVMRAPLQNLMLAAGFDVQIEIERDPRFAGPACMRQVVAISEEVTCRTCLAPDSALPRGWLRPPAPVRRAAHSPPPPVAASEAICPHSLRYIRAK